MTITDIYVYALTIIGLVLCVVVMYQDSRIYDLTRANKRLTKRIRNDCLGIPSRVKHCLSFYEPRTYRQSNEQRIKALVPESSSIDKRAAG